MHRLICSSAAVAFDLFFFLVKEEFLDVVYWSRQLLSAILGAIWASIPLNGIVGILM